MPARDQASAGPATVTSAPIDLEGADAGAGDAAVGDVADDPDPLAVERAEPVEQRVDVEQRLARVLVLAVAGVDDRRPRSSGRPGPRRPRAGERITIASGS